MTRASSAWFEASDPDRFGAWHRFYDDSIARAGEPDRTECVRAPARWTLPGTRPTCWTSAAASASCHCIWPVSIDPVVAAGSDAGMARLLRRMSRRPPGVPSTSKHPPAARAEPGSVLGLRAQAPAASLVGIDEVEALAAVRQRAGEAVVVLLDARPGERYAGQPDELDPRAGHIPGARNLPCRASLGEDGRLLPAPALRAKLEAVGVHPGGPPVISSCGSGVTACHTLLVLEHLGWPPGQLYPGSWSQWSRSARPAVVGADVFEPPWPPG